VLITDCLIEEGLGKDNVEVKADGKGQDRLDDCAERDASEAARQVFVIIEVLDGLGGG
jgi:hypothetical protein